MSTTLYAPGSRPPDYRDFVWLYTEGETVCAVVDGAPPGPEGRKFTIEPGKAKKVPWEAGRFLLEHLGYTGVVRVRETDREDGTGTDLDIESAKIESAEKLLGEDERRWQDYVRYCIDDKINNKRVVPPTPDSIKRIMARRGYKLEDFGIQPAGEAAPADTRIAQLQKMVKDLTAKLNDALGEPKQEQEAPDGENTPLSSVQASDRPRGRRSSG